VEISFEGLSGAGKGMGESSEGIGEERDETGSKIGFGVVVSTDGNGSVRNNSMPKVPWVDASADTDS
jgi:hypothetical protein